MSFRDHIVSCNNYDPARVVPLFAGEDRVGLLRRDNAAALRRFPDVFAAGENGFFGAEFCFVALSGTKHARLA